ncbi:MAG TPA: Trk system potassium transporter TrkA [Acholeplasmataceae bacterium]|nr:Trk system potassium transporter TrkA [Acholeplasmataceae bacterium]
MKIIIVGIGKIGRNLTYFLSQENHDITVIDTNPNVIENIVGLYDVKGIVGNGASNEILQEAEIQKTDLLIASSSSDELNILCSLVGKMNGVKYTIARVRNPEYSSQINFMHHELGLNMIVNPELEAANEILQMLKFPSALQVDKFAGGKVDIVEIKLEEASPIVGKTLSNIRTNFQIKFLICAVERDGKAYIPSGDFILQPKDKIYVTASNKEIVKFFKKLGILKDRARKVMIIGGSKISYYLAKQLEEANVDVKIIEMDINRCQELSDTLNNVTIIHGAGSDHNLLEEEGISSCDAFVTLTGLDEENIITSLYAIKKNISKVITKINRDNLTDILGTIGIDSIISPKAIITNSVLSFIRSIENTFGSKVKRLYKLVNNQVEATEFYIQQKTNFTNVLIKDLKTKPNVLIACIIRNNNIIIPTGNDLLKPQDSVIVVSTDQIRNLSEILE